jgi:hypothetical protein
MSEYNRNNKRACQNGQKQDAWLHCSTVQMPLFIDVPDHFPASWLNNRTSHLAILTGL